MRSSTISFSDGLRSESSTLTAFISPLPESLTATRPPPDVPSTSICSSSVCIASILDLSSAACFINPRKSAMTYLFRARSALAIIFIRLPNMRQLAAKGSIVVERRFLHFQLGTARRCLSSGRLAFAHVDNLGTGETREYRLHERVRLHAGFEFRLSLVALGFQRRLARLGGDHDHPLPLRP